jgi:hypothetical protein
MWEIYFTQRKIFLVNRWISIRLSYNLKIVLIKYQNIGSFQSFLKC